MNTLTEKERQAIIEALKDCEIHQSHRGFIADAVLLKLAELRKEEAQSKEQIPLGFNVYKKTATVMAKLFEKGDEDGMIHREGMIGAMEDARNGLQPNLIPYVSTLENKFLQGDFGKNYLCVGIDVERWLVEKSIFERTYEIAKLLTPDVNADTVTKDEMYKFGRWCKDAGRFSSDRNELELYEQFKNLPQKL